MVVANRIIVTWSRQENLTVARQTSKEFPFLRRTPWREFIIAPYHGTITRRSQHKSVGVLATVRTLVFPILKTIQVFMQSDIITIVLVSMKCASKYIIMADARPKNVRP